MSWERLAAILPAQPGHLAVSRVQFLLDRLGNPERSFPAVQVGGSQGKSCVISILEAVFTAGGVKVGSLHRPDQAGQPHDARVMGAQVPEQALLEEAERGLFPLEDFLAGPGRPTLFETLAAATMSYFAREQVEIALLEAGADSRRDALCNLTQPLLSLVTPVDTDSELYDLGQVALNELGLAKQGIPFLTTEWKGEVLALFARQCREQGAALVLVDRDDIQLVEASWERSVWRSRDDLLGLGAFETQFVGAYQGANLALALGALAELVGGLPVSRSDILEGLAATELPERFEIVSRRPYIVLDRARSSWELGALVRSLEQLPDPGGRRYLLCGTEQDKLVRAGAALTVFDEVSVLESAEALEKLEDRLRKLTGSLGEKDVLVVCGRPAFLREARGVLEGTAR